MHFKKPRIKAEPQPVSSFPSHNWNAIRAYNNKKLEEDNAAHRFKATLKWDAYKDRQMVNALRLAFGVIILYIALGIGAILYATFILCNSPL